MWRRGEKKRESMGGSAGIAREGATISACQVPVKHLVLPGGPKSGVCEVGIGMKTVGNGNYSVISFLVVFL